MQMWNRSLDETTEFAVLPVVTLQEATIPDWFWDGLQFDWDLATYKTDNGAVRSIPSLRGQKVCPAGTTAEPVGAAVDLQTCEGDGKLISPHFSMKT